MSKPAEPAPVAQPSYEEARDELTEIVRKLESGGAGLAETMALWERGEAMAAVCRRHLDGARATIDAARKAAEGDAPPA